MLCADRATAYVRLTAARPGVFRAMFGGAPPAMETAEALRADPSTAYRLFVARLVDVIPAERCDSFLAC